MVTSGLREVYTWFRSLTGAQQDSIRRWIEGGAAMLLVATVLPRIAAAITGMVMPAFSSLVVLVTRGAGAIGLAISTAFAGIPTLLGLLASVGAGFAVGTSGGRGILSGLLESIRPAWEGLKTFVADIHQQFAPTLTMLGESAGRVFKAVGEAIRSAMSSAGPALADIADIIGRLVATFLPSLEQAFTKTLVFAVEVGAEAFRGLATAFRFVANVFVESINVMKRGLANFTEGLSYLAEAWPRLFGSWINPGAMRAIADELRRPLELAEAASGRSGGKGRDSERKDVTLAGGTFESVTDLWRRLQSTALQTEDPSARDVRRTAAATEGMLEIMRTGRGMGGGDVVIDARKVMGGTVSVPVVP
jgi:hypothetical protein